MSLNNSDVESLQRVFNQGFSVRDIAEPLASFDTPFEPVRLRAFMDEHDFDVVGVRQAGLVRGLVEKSQLDEPLAPHGFQEFDAEQMCDESAPLALVVRRLANAPRLFVSVLGQVGGIVTRGDLQKPPVRMWLFGMVTLVEMRLTRMISQVCPDGWQQFLSEGRLEKARKLLSERQRRNQNLELLDCLQLADKGQIIARNVELRQRTMFESRRKLEEAVKGLEALRNNLAHSQDIVSCDWETIVQLSENLDRVILGPPGLRDESD